MLSERSHSEKMTCGMLLLIWNDQIGKSIEKEIRFLVMDARFLLKVWKYSEIRLGWWLHKAVKMIQNMKLYILNKWVS